MEYKFSNAEVKKLVAMGTKATMQYKYQIDDEKSITYEWCPISEHELDFAMADSLDSISSLDIRNWLVSTVEARQEMINNGLLVPSSMITKFQFTYAMNVIWHAMKTLYDGITRGDIEQMPMNHLEFRKLISVASGAEKSKETLEPFPAEQSPQDTEDEVEDGSSA